MKPFKTQNSRLRQGLFNERLPQGDRLALIPNECQS